MISIILPTYNEADGINLTISRIRDVLLTNKIEAEIIVVDDNSPDGTAEVIRAGNLTTEVPVDVHVRTNERGLASAVIKGLELSRGEVCVVMDADLSHPVDALPALVEPILSNKADIAVGSRYIRGGGVIDWPLKRRIISRGAGLLAFGLTRLADPTSGFMAVRKSVLRGVTLNPIGWKIVLEVVVRTGARTVEVPIHFADREKGQSKLSAKTQIDYLKHLWALYCWRIGVALHLHPAR